MDDDQLAKDLGSIGMACFVNYFTEFSDESLSDDDVTRNPSGARRMGGDFDSESAGTRGAQNHQGWSSQRCSDRRIELIARTQGGSRQSPEICARIKRRGDLKWDYKPDYPTPFLTTRFFNQW